MFDFVISEASIKVEITADGAKGRSYGASG